MYPFQHALAEYLRPKRVVVWILVAAALYVVSVMFLRVGPKAEQPELYAMLSTTLLFRVLPLLSAIFSTAVVSGEVEQKTILYLLTRPIPRPKLLLQRAAASMLVVFGLATICALFVSAAVYGTAFLSNPLLPRDILALAVGSLAYGSLFLLVSLLVNRAMIVCLLFAFGWETSVPNMPGDIYKLSIFSYLQAIAEHPSTETTKGLLGFVTGQLNPNLITSSAAMQVMTVLVLATLVGSAWWFSHFEYVPREDAE